MHESDDCEPGGIDNMRLLREMNREVEISARRLRCAHESVLEQRQFSLQTRPVTCSVSPHLFLVLLFRRLRPFLQSLAPAPEWRCVNRTRQ